MIFFTDNYCDFERWRHYSDVHHGGAEDYLYMLNDFPSPPGLFYSGNSSNEDRQAKRQWPSISPRQS